MPSKNSCCDLFNLREAYRQGLLKEWIPLSFTDSGMMSGLLLTACRSLHDLYQNGPFQAAPYLQLALKYKLALMRSISSDISKQGEQGASIAELTIAKTIMLAGDEVSRSHTFAISTPLKPAPH